MVAKAWAELAAAVLGVVATYLLAAWVKVTDKQFRLKGIGA